MNNSLHPDIQSNFIQLENLKLHYLSIGAGESILMLHGWPTSSYLWRNVMPELSKNNQVIALDLPGFGQSDKVLEDSFSFNYYDRIIDSFLEKLEISKVHLVVHDLGGPVGLYWATKHPEKIKSLVLLNTLVYPEMSWAVKLFMLMTFMPVVKKWLWSSSGIVWAMRLGVYNKSKLTKDILYNYHIPFSNQEKRKVLLKTVQRLSPKGFITIAQKLQEFNIPVRLIYGENDKILPDVAKTMERVKKDLPQAEIFSIAKCGHFLHEDEPERLSELLVEFYNSK